MMRRALLLTLLSSSLLGCATNSSQQEALIRTQSIVPPQQLALEDFGADRYANATPEFAGVESSPTPSTASSTSNSKGSDARTLENLFARQATESDCVFVGNLAMEYSDLSKQQDGSASITNVLDTRLLGDWSKTVSLPGEGEKAPVLRCWARVRWSIGVESDVDLWLLIDSNKDARVRWDNIQNVSENDSDM